MKNIIIIFSLLFASFNLNAQMDPISWTYEYQVNDAGEQTIVLSADMDDEWVLYAQNTPKGGPVATSFTFDEQAGVKWKDNTVPHGKLIKKFSPLFELEVFKYTKAVQFTQSFEANDSVKKITGSVFYMTCNGQQCLPPKEVKFEVPLNN